MTPNMVHLKYYEGKWRNGNGNGMEMENEVYV